MRVVSYKSEFFDGFLSNLRDFPLFPPLLWLMAIQSVDVKGERERESPCALDCLSTNILYAIVPHQLIKHQRWRALIFAWDEKIEENI
jgi:hypothetical protein